MKPTGGRRQARNWPARPTANEERNLVQVARLEARDAAHFRPVAEQDFAALRWISPCRSRSANTRLTLTEVWPVMSAICCWVNGLIILSSASKAPAGRGFAQQMRDPRDRIAPTAIDQPFVADLLVALDQPPEESRISGCSRRSDRNHRPCRPSFRCGRSPGCHNRRSLRAGSMPSPGKRSATIWRRPVPSFCIWRRCPIRRTSLRCGRTPGSRNGRRGSTLTVRCGMSSGRIQAA